MKGLILDTTSFDLTLSSGSLSIGSTNEQNAQLILLASKGEWKEYPSLGASLSQYLHSLASDNEIKRNIKLQMQLDNIPIKTLTVSDGVIHLDIL